ncbi:Aerobic cobaltochelatase subunit CobN [Paenibacillus konkukensis]|uniref:Aerobic cobaltochelatase subunit CobN n=1 Tax=Paenibacillus konkukensis TaxID=2020716 RepID=A0ABY4RHB4_9BACL|nr:cobaltochelatase subunit CobN [Paenibacillus konkukensis]UQZ81540.1 Aerobic cobaltochelatase subunit CobN [Paenibacillus konkukensis]
MLHIALLTTSYSAAADVSRLMKQPAAPYYGHIRLSVFHEEQAAEPEWAAAMKQAAEEAGLLLLDPHGTSYEWLQPSLQACADSSAHKIVVGGDAEPLRKLARLGSLEASELPPSRGDRRFASPQGLSAEKRRDYANYLRIIDYWRGGGTHNLHQLFLLIGREYGGFGHWPEPEPPVVLQELGLWEPGTGTYYATRQEHLAAHPHQEGLPVVAVLFSARSYPMHTAGCAAGIIERIRSFAHVLPIAFPALAGADADRLQALLENGGRPASLIVSLLPFRLGAGPVGGDSQKMTAMLEKLGAPLLHPFLLTKRERKEWMASPQGLTPSEFLVQMMLPELDGGIEMLPVAALHEVTEEGDEAPSAFRMKELRLIPDRVERLAGRMQRWLRLQSKPRAEKNVAVICYNYPPGEGNVFGAAFLDTFASAARLLQLLVREGYDTEALTAEQVKSRFVDGGIVNSPHWSEPDHQGGMIRYGASGYESRFGSMPRADEMEQEWGTPPGDVMVRSGQFLIPGIQVGRVFVGLQPARGVHEHPEKTYHDSSLPPPHQYAAFYEWLRDSFEADAVIHVGTHGTLEFLPGKESGMSSACFPDHLIGDLPHLYYYYVGNPSEAMIAKRRSHAVLIGYQSPPFTVSELYGEYGGLDALLHEYREAERSDPSRCPVIRGLIAEQAERLKLPDTIEAIETELYRTSRSAIPSGLHVLGEGLEHEAALQYARFVLRFGAGGRSLRGIIADCVGIDDEKLQEQPDRELLERLDALEAAALERYMAGQELPGELQPNPGQLEELQAALAGGRSAYEASRLNREEEHLLQALDGRYIPVRLAGDAIRQPEVLPSGFNLVQFDPRSVPSAAAVRRGAAIADNTLRMHYEKNGSYPETAAVVLWGLETSRTQGETVGQILHYLGVRVNERMSWARSNYEIVPAEELGRPRINVLITICGFFRDMFPNVLQELHELFVRVSELDEPEVANGFKKQSLLLHRALVEEGYEPGEAWDMACARIFGPAEGQYGTSISRLIETKQWEDESQFAELFTKRLQHLYSGQHRGTPMPGLFRRQLSAVEIVSQVRSNHEHEITDLDHYYEYFGGLAKSVERAKGSQADIVITDTTGEEVWSEPVEQSILRGVRTRLTNPKWIDGLLRHDYHGAQHIARRFENVLGLAATTNRVDPWIFRQLHETYVADERMSRRLEDNNPWAYHHMVETLLESHQRGYWQASDEELEQLYESYMQLEGKIEEQAE